MTTAIVEITALDVYQGGHSSLHTPHYETFTDNAKCLLRQNSCGCVASDSILFVYFNVTNCETSIGHAVLFLISVTYPNPQLLCCPIVPLLQVIASPTPLSPVPALIVTILHQPAAFGHLLSLTLLCLLWAMASEANYYLNFTSTLPDSAVLCPTSAASLLLQFFFFF